MSDSAAVPPVTARDAGLSAVARDVRDHDPNRFQTVLFAPSGKREALFALYALNIELSRIAETVSEPLIGQMRLQWWADALTALCGEGGRVPEGHPVTDALVDVLAPETAKARFGGPPPLHELLVMIDARQLDLEQAPFADLEAMERYAAETAGCLSWLAARLLGAPEGLERAARASGTAWGLLGLVRSLPFQAAEGRMCLPSQFVDGNSISVEQLSNPESEATPAGAILEIVELAENLFRESKLFRGRMDPVWMSPFLLNRLAKPYLRQLRTTNGKLHDPVLHTIHRKPVDLFLSALFCRL